MGPACRNGFPTEAKTEAGEPKVNDSRLLRAISVCSLGHQIRSLALPHFRGDSARPETTTRHRGRSLVIGYPQPKCSEGGTAVFLPVGFASRVLSLESILIFTRPSTHRCSPVQMNFAFAIRLPQSNSAQKDVCESLVVCRNKIKNLNIIGPVTLVSIR